MPITVPSLCHHYARFIVCKQTCSRRLRTKLYDKRVDFNFPILNLQFKFINIPATPAYGEYIYLSWYDIQRLVVSLMSSLIDVSCYQRSYRTGEFYCRRHDLANRSRISVRNNYGYVLFVVIIIRFFPHDLTPVL